MPLTIPTNVRISVDAISVLALITRWMSPSLASSMNALHRVSDPTDHEGRVGVDGPHERVAERRDDPRGRDRHHRRGDQDRNGDGNLSHAPVVLHATNSFQGGDRITDRRVE